jgi:hypothetical protein
MIERFEEIERRIPVASYNTDFVVRYAHPNSVFGGLSHTHQPLSEIMVKKLRLWLR